MYWIDRPLIKWHLSEFFIGRRIVPRSDNIVYLSNTFTTADSRLSR